jgi:hypothetical protein
MRTDHRELQDLICQLIETLHQELHQHQRLLGAVRHRKTGAPAGEGHDLLLRGEKEILADIATVERDRISLLTELGQILGHPTPSRLRIAELILHANPEGRDELLDLRDDFRDVADELETLTAVEPTFERHRVGQIRLYLRPSRLEVLPRTRRERAEPSPGAANKTIDESSANSRKLDKTKGSVAHSGGDAA